MMGVSDISSKLVKSITENDGFSAEDISLAKFHALGISQDLVKTREKIHEVLSNEREKYTKRQDWVDSFNKISTLP